MYSVHVLELTRLVYTQHKNNKFPNAPSHIW